MTEKKIWKDEEISSKEFVEMFNSKKRLCCSGCGCLNFRLIPTEMPNTTIDEAVFMICKNCGHKRLELV